MLISMSIEVDWGIFYRAGTQVVIMSNDI